MLCTSSLVVQFSKISVARFFSRDLVIIPLSSLLVNTFFQISLKKFFRLVRKGYCATLSQARSYIIQHFTRNVKNFFEEKFHIKSTFLKPIVVQFYNIVRHQKKTIPHREIVFFLLFILLPPRFNIDRSIDLFYIRLKHLSISEIGFGRSPFAVRPLHQQRLVGQNFG